MIAAIVRAVNDTKDDDTITAIVGAAVGALHGRKGLPHLWMTGLLGRTAEDDDGQVFDLADLIGGMAEGLLDLAQELGEKGEHPSG